MNVRLTVISGNATQQDADAHGNADGNESHSERDPRALQHSGEDIAPQIVRAQKVDTQTGDFFRPQVFNIGFCQRAEALNIIN